MSTIEQLKRHHGIRSKGQYTLLRVEQRTTCFGSAFQQLDLADHTGSIRAYVWSDGSLPAHLSATIPVPVQATLCSRSLDTWIVADLAAVHVLDPNEVVNAAALLPLEQCPPAARPALAKLVDFVARLRPDPLRDFLNRVLLDPEVATTLTRCRASQHHHHSQPGGLLIHSIEVLEITGDMIGTRLTPLERSITEVAALLHDLGKLRAVGTTTVRPIHCQLVSHGAQTTRMLDPHLQWLRARAPEAAAGLDYTLEFLAHPADQRFAKFLGADLVRAADRMSAALCNRKRLQDLTATTVSVETTKNSSISHPGAGRKLVGVGKPSNTFRC